MNFESQSMPAPPKISRPLSPGVLIRTVLAALVLSGVTVIFFFNPGTHSFYPVCWFHRLTGLNCPGCGSTRAAYALLHGNFLLALKDNALFVFTAILMAIKLPVFLFRQSRDPNAAFYLSPKMLWAFLVVAVIFTLLRNLPAFSFLSP